MKNIFLRFLNFSERVGNKLPDPITLFLVAIAILFVISEFFSGVQLPHPLEETTITARSLFDRDLLQKVFSEAQNNFAKFPPLAGVLIIMMGIGIAEKSGLASAALRRILLKIPPQFLTFAVIFSGVLSSLVIDAGYLVITPLAGLAFASVGRHPLAGIAASFAGVAGGFSANIFLTPLDVILAGISSEAANLVDKTYKVHPAGNYYFMFVSTFLLTVLATWVNSRFVEPRLGKWAPTENFTSMNINKFEPRETKALKQTFLFAIMFLGVAFFLIYPEGAFFRDSEGKFSNFYNSLIPLLALFFFLIGLIYGIANRSIRSDKDVAKMLSDSLGSMGYYIVLSFVAAQFVAYFSWSNLGPILAVKGSSLFKELGGQGPVLLLLFVFTTALMDLFIGSASAKWAILAPIFIPMFMMMGIAPESTQLAYRIGDSSVNMISPLLPYLPVILVFARKYDSSAGFGTLLSCLLPYSIAFLFFWSALMSIWMGLDLPLGPNVPLHYP